MVQRLSIQFEFFVFCLFSFGATSGDLLHVEITPSELWGLTIRGVGYWTQVSQEPSTLYHYSGPSI